MITKERHYVVAGTRSQAFDYLHRLPNKDDVHVVYIDSWLRLSAYYGISLKAVGTYYELPEWTRMRQRAEQRSMKIEYV